MQTLASDVLPFYEGLRLKGIADQSLLTCRSSNGFWRAIETAGLYKVLRIKKWFFQYYHSVVLSALSLRMVLKDDGFSGIMWSVKNMTHWFQFSNESMLSHGWWPDSVRSYPWCSASNQLASFSPSTYIVLDFWVGSNFKSNLSNKTRQNRYLKCTGFTRHNTLLSKPSDCGSL